MKTKQSSRGYWSVTLLGFNASYIGKGQLFAQQFYCSTPGGLTFRIMYSKAFGLTAEIASSPNFGAKWSKHLIQVSV